LKRKLWEKILLIGALLGLVGGTLAGCGGQTSPTAENGGPVVLHTLYMNQAGYTDKVLEDMAAEFHKQNPDITVEFSFVPYDSLHDKIVTSASSPTATYDVVLEDLIWSTEFAKKGYVIPLESYINKDIDTKDIAPALFSPFEVDGHTWAMPFLANFQNFFYNAAMLKKAGFSGPPKTMDEWLNQMETLKKDGIVKYPWIDSWKQEEGLVCDYVRTAGEYGANLFDKDGNPIMNQGGALKALEFMRKTVDLGLVDPNSLTADEPTAMNAFISGNAAFNTNWTFVYGKMNDPSSSKIVGQGQVTTFPVDSGTNQPSASVSGFQGLAIMANSKHQDAAWKWIQFATSKEIQAQHLDEMPIWTSVQKSPEALKANPAINVYTENLDNVYNRPLVPDYMQVSTIIQKYVHAVLAQEMSPQAGADAMVKDIKALNNSQ